MSALQNVLLTGLLEPDPTFERGIAKQASMNRSRAAIESLIDASNLLRSQSEALVLYDDEEDVSLPSAEVQTAAVQRFLSRRLSRQASRIKGCATGSRDDDAGDGKSVESPQPPSGGEVGAADGTAGGETALVGKSPLSNSSVPTKDLPGKAGAASIRGTDQGQEKQQPHLQQSQAQAEAEALSPGPPHGPGRHPVARGESEERLGAQDCHPDKAEEEGARASREETGGAPGTKLCAAVKGPASGKPSVEVILDD